MSTSRIIGTWSFALGPCERHHAALAGGDDPLDVVQRIVADVEREFPGELEKIRIWFRDYKTPDGKPLNAFGHNEEALPQNVCLEVIEETHEFWQNLRDGKTDAGKLWLR